MMKKLYLTCNDKNEYTFSSIATLLGVSRHNPVFNDVMHFFIENRVILIDRVEGRNQILKIKTEGVKYIVEESSCYEEVSDYIRKTRTIYANI